MPSNTPEFVYLNWIKARCHGARINLSSSGMPPPGPEVLRLTCAPRNLDIVDTKGFQPLFSRIARHVGMPAEQVLAVPGCTYAMHLAIRATLGPGDEAVVETPTYELLPLVLASHGITAVPVRRDAAAEFDLDVAAVRRAVTPRTRAIVLTSPHNPSGRLLRPSQIEALATLAEERDLIVVVDEVYLDFHPPAARAYGSIAALSPRFVAASSLTKAHGLSALRLGWIAGPPAIVAQAWRWQEILADRVPALEAQAGCLAFDRMDALRARATAAYAPGFAILREFAARCDLAVIDPGAGITALLEVPKHLDTAALAETLFSQDGVLAPPGEMFGCPGFLRVSWAVPEATLRAGLDAIALRLGR